MQRGLRGDRVVLARCERSSQGTDTTKSRNSRPWQMAEFPAPERFGSWTEARTEARLDFRARPFALFEQRRQLSQSTPPLPMPAPVSSFALVVATRSQPR